MSDDVTDLKPSKRMSVTLIPKANTELEWLQGNMQLSQVDIINRAIQVLGFLQRRTEAGGELLIRQHGETEKVHII